MNIKNITYLVAAVAFACCVQSCEKELESYSHQESYLNFRFQKSNGDDMLNSELASSNSVVNTPVQYNFKTHGTIQQDTIWLQAKYIGFVTDYDREYTLEQIEVAGADNAVPGVDYVAFDNPEAQRVMVVKAGESNFLVPVILLRSSGLQKKDAILKVRFKENKNFKNGFSNMQTRIISFTDRLTKPAVWDEYNLDLLFGSYGDVKFQLMLDWSGLSWSDEFISEMYTTDKAYFDYLSALFKKRLAEENAERQSRGEDVWREADGTAISFSPALPPRP